MKLEEEQFMIVRIGNEPYGIKIKDIKEVIPNSEITNVPDKESIYICGVMKCRYGCVDVFDIYSYCLLFTSTRPRDAHEDSIPSSA